MAVAADAADKDVGHLDSPQGRLNDMLGPYEGLPHQFAFAQRHQIEHSRGHGGRHLHRRPPKGTDWVQGLAPRYGNLAHLSLLMEHEDAQGGADCPLPQGAWHEVATVILP